MHSEDHRIEDKSLTVQARQSDRELLSSGARLDVGPERIGFVRRRDFEGHLDSLLAGHEVGQTISRPGGCQFAEEHNRLRILRNGDRIVDDVTFVVEIDSSRQPGVRFLVDNHQILVREGWALVSRRVVGVVFANQDFVFQIPGKGKAPCPRSRIPSPLP